MTRQVDALVGLEIPVERRRLDAEALRDLSQRQVAQAPRIQELQSGSDDLLLLGRGLALPARSLAIDTSVDLLPLARGQTDR